MNLAVTSLVVMVCIHGVWSEVRENVVINNGDQTVEQLVEEQPSTVHVCYERVGCFHRSTGSGLDGKLPQSPVHVLTMFELYTRERKDVPQVLDARYPDEFSSVLIHYKSTRPTLFIVHGFLDIGGDNPWTMEMKHALMHRGDYNLIIVDWHNGNIGSYYQESANAMLVGAQLAHLIIAIMNETHQRASDFHIIGHGLGAHVAGYAGARVQHETHQQIGRISGLDPSGPGFEGQDLRHRLDDTDANFVDVIHTDATKSDHTRFGTSQRMGHANFFVNLGYDQPGCQEGQQVERILKDELPTESTGFACSHKRAYQYYIESINSECQFVGFPCENKQLFLSGSCKSCSVEGCNHLGYLAHQPAQPTHYFLNTSAHAPFCEHPYEVQVHISSKDPNSHRGQVMVKLFGERTHSALIPLSENAEVFLPGQTYTYTIAIPEQLGKVTSVEFRWNQISKDEYRQCSLMLAGLTVNPLASEYKRKFCADDLRLPTDFTTTLSNLCQDNH